MKSLAQFFIHPQCPRKHVLVVVKGSQCFQMVHMPGKKAVNITGESAGNAGVSYFFTFATNLVDFDVRIRRCSVI
jgi:hypothetical protein